MFCFDAVDVHTQYFWNFFKQWREIKKCGRIPNFILFSYKKSPLLAIQFFFRNSDADDSGALHDTDCTKDYITVIQYGQEFLNHLIRINEIFQIPSGETATNAAIVDYATVVSSTKGQRFCGRNLNVIDSQASAATLCSKLTFNLRPEI